MVFAKDNRTSRYAQTRYPYRGTETYHSIGLFTGQPLAFHDKSTLYKLCGPTGLPQTEDLPAIRGARLDHLEISEWNWDFSSADTDEGALAIAYALLEEVRTGLENPNAQVASISCHLPGQQLGNNPDATTLQFSDGAIQQEYWKWRDAHAGAVTRANWWYVPAEIGTMMLQDAITRHKRAGRVAYFLGKLQGRIVPVTSFPGQPCRIWDTASYQWPPIPNAIGGRPLWEGLIAGDIHSTDGRENLIRAAYEQLIEMWGPVWQFYKEFAQREDEDFAIRDVSRNPADRDGDTRLQFEHSWAHGHPVYIAYEDHPTEITPGDLYSTRRFVEEVRVKAGFYNAGFNNDDSHKKWQNVCNRAWLREFHGVTYARHVKGMDNHPGEDTDGGLIGGFSPMRDLANGKHFVATASPRDRSRIADIDVQMMELGLFLAKTIELEENHQYLVACLPLIADNLRRLDLPPTAGAFDKFAGGN